MQKVNVSPIEHQALLGRIWYIIATQVLTVDIYSILCSATVYDVTHIIHFFVLEVADFKLYPQWHNVK